VPTCPLLGLRRGCSQHVQAEDDEGEGCPGCDEAHLHVGRETTTYLEVPVASGDTCQQNLADSQLRQAEGTGEVGLLTTNEGKQQCAAWGRSCTPERFAWPSRPAVGCAC